MRILILPILLAFLGCKSVDSSVFSPQFTPGPATIVYKTKNDYRNNVPLLLSEDKSEIISYPHPADLMTNGKYTIPLTLKKGYLLDNRGINQNVAFLKMSYEEYANLNEVPSLQALYDNILDKDPLKEICDCGNRAAFSDIEKEINLLIRRKQLKKVCKELK
jgi:hypothetical protein